uniref:Uncharacterized protein n=1 Tax=Aegilops tauschii subsp. strangulata TaxID=200361 RepID=A0A453LZT4_AEGTS
RQSERAPLSGLFPSRHISAEAGPAGVRCHHPIPLESPAVVTTYLATRRRSVRPPGLPTLPVLSSYTFSPAAAVAVS